MSDTELLKNIDERTRLAGTNKLEILMFSLGMDTRTQRREIYGINVFKVREVMKAPPITRVPDLPKAVVGMVSLRGTIVPVVDIADYAGILIETPPTILVVTEYNGHVQGFMVESVDTILRLDWSQMRVPPDMLTARSGGLVTSVTELEGGQLVMLLDVEKILAETSNNDDEHRFAGVTPLTVANKRVFFADDSSVARKQIARTLSAMNIAGTDAINGKDAWIKLEAMASAKMLPDLILTDVEMPEMDGYMLTRKIKEDARFKGIPVIMHSSLSGSSNQNLGMAVGVDEYVSKFEPQRLAQTIKGFLE